MDRTTYINNVYKKLCDAFVRDCDPKENDKLSIAYLKYLHEQYDRYFEEVPAEEKEWNRVAVFCVKKEKVVNLTKTSAAKTAFLFPDESYVKLESLSLEIARCAAEKRNGTMCANRISKEEYEKKLNLLLNSVSELYKYSAEKMYSEAMVDLGYVFDGNDDFSFRQHKF